MSANDILAGIANNIGEMLDHEFEASTSTPEVAMEIDNPVMAVDDTTEIMEFFGGGTSEEMANSDMSYQQNLQNSLLTRARRPCKMAREIQSLSFRNPGSEMSKFLPDSVDILSRTRGRRTNATTKPNYEDGEEEFPMYHERAGKLVVRKNGETNQYDMCDCLRVECSGCHWPCSSCKSKKCGFQCRQSRREVIAKIEEMCTTSDASAHQIVLNPYMDLSLASD
ncbi:unnamed protein product [Caenorhabditis bovis]|uniref:ARF7 effector protein C-terminal domain-containing protein n=1 Tax=Caenorhabditis bovis TaxID=2654633 RepID=A0A8S1EQ18_9PELO|nr:unnamed protein product [Caenorhabditis bovis]